MVHGQMDETITSQESIPGIVIPITVQSAFYLEIY
jgi:hypothetical protein